MDSNSERSPVEDLSRATSALGGNMSKERKDLLYFGKPPKTAYFGFNKDVKHIHDLSMSEEQKNRLYGVGEIKERTSGEVVSARLETDSKRDLIRELTDETPLTRREAEQIVDAWMLRNELVEIEDAQLGKIIVPRNRG